VPFAMNATARKPPSFTSWSRRITRYLRRNWPPGVRRYPSMSSESSQITSAAAAPCIQLQASGLLSGAPSPSCGARRMAESAALLVDEILPEVPMRQWVLRNSSYWAWVRLDLGLIWISPCNDYTQLQLRYRLRSGTFT
jgi:hypothetical protein